MYICHKKNQYIFVVSLAKFIYILLFFQKGMKQVIITLLFLYILSYNFETKDGKTLIYLKYYILSFQSAFM